MLGCFYNMHLSFIDQLDRMNTLKTFLICTAAVLSNSISHAHYPYVAPLSFQTFNNYTAIVAGFYDNPFAPEVAIKNFDFHFHTPTGEKIYIKEQDWLKTRTLSAYSLENKMDGTYRIRGEKQGSTAKFALDAGTWKALVNAEPKGAANSNTNVVYASKLDKNARVKNVKTTEIVESFVSRRQTSDHVIKHIHGGFDIQFLTHPNAIKVNQPVTFKVLDDQQGVANLKVELLSQTHDFSREEKVFQTLTTAQDGTLNFKIPEKGQYLLKLDYQQSFDSKMDELKRYKYTLAFNVID